jgi:transcriptional regulator with XRE-family HTH domain
MMIGELIQTWRKTRGLSLQDAARRIGVEYTALWRFEQGNPVAESSLVKIMVWLLTAEARGQSKALPARRKE